VPHGVLFRGVRPGAYQEKMIEENLLDAVIGLPATFSDIQDNLWQFLCLTAPASKVQRARSIMSLY
jgi:molecular chaperone DnaK (HSP70)